MVTASQLASSVGARRIRRGQWLALCPIHGDRKPSLSISEGKKCILLNCRSHQCEASDICRSWGIPIGSLFYGDRKRIFSETDFSRLKKLEHKLGWFLVWKAITPRRRQYCEKAIEGIEKDIRKLEETLYPEKAFRRRIAETLKTGDFDKLWEMVLPRFTDVREPIR